MRVGSPKEPSSGPIGSNALEKSQEAPLTSSLHELGVHSAMAEFATKYFRYDRELM